ncbi:hypothetical protein DRW41_02650 [Neobacillus piezotolerans]|uniref:Uncharacterized protein n=1 Tax=Neobacillus piezotolerans TaxID=2259171 RepID=A0A3D8GVT6_9BACI|nr:hypothetical protein DRW41_02650 [Neobacillus piezotolerans]
MIHCQLTNTLAIGTPAAIPPAFYFVGCPHKNEPTGMSLKRETPSVYPEWRAKKGEQLCGFQMLL